MNKQIEDNDEFPYWSCEWCDARNFPGTLYCKECGEPIDTRESKELAEELAYDLHEEEQRAKKTP